MSVPAVAASPCLVHERTVVIDRPLRLSSSATHAAKPPLRVVWVETRCEPDEPDGGADTSSSATPSQVRPAILFLHGMAAHSNFGFFSDLTRSLLQTQRLAAHFNLVIRLNFTNCGEENGVCSFGFYADQVEDVQDAMLSLQDKHSVKVCCIISHSMGSNVSLCWAAQYSQNTALIRCLVALCPRFDMTSPLRFPTHLMKSLPFVFRPRSAVKDPLMASILVTQQGIDERMQLDMRDVATRVAAQKLPCLIVHGTDDQVIPTNDSQLLTSYMPLSQLLLIPGADHNFSCPEHVWEVTTGMVSFLIETLLPHCQA